MAQKIFSKYKNDQRYFHRGHTPRKSKFLDYFGIHNPWLK